MCNSLVIKILKIARLSSFKRSELFGEGQISIESTKTPKSTFQKLPPTGKMETYNFIIHEVAVTVPGKAKYVHKAPDSMVVNF